MNLFIFWNTKGPKSKKEKKTTLLQVEVTKHPKNHELSSDTPEEEAIVNRESPLLQHISDWTKHQHINFFPINMHETIILIEGKQISNLMHDNPFHRTPGIATIDTTDNDLRIHLNYQLTFLPNQAQTFIHSPLSTLKYLSSYRSSNLHTLPTSPPYTQ